MKVRDWMTSNVEACAPDDNLSCAAMVMWRRDCGFVPVVRPEDRKLVGVLTDRDICVATSTRHAAPEALRVKDVMSARPFVTRPNEDVRDALKTMRDRQVRRLPVVDTNGHVQGVLSLNDITRAASAHVLEGPSAVTYGDVVDALKVIGRPRELQSLPTPEPVP